MSETALTDETGRVIFRGTQSPGGGSQPGAVRMLGPFTITAADFVGPDGFGFWAAPIYTPAVGGAITGFAWILRTVFTGNFTEGFQIAPQTSADTGTAGPALITTTEHVHLGTPQGQGPGNTGGDYCVASFLSPDLGPPYAPSVAGPVISDGTALYLAGAVEGFDPGGQLDIYVYVATPALA